MYAPYSTTFSTSHVFAVATGVFIAGFSSILTGLNFIVTVHEMRAPGMTWFRLPLFIWAMYATSLILVLATPVLAMTLMLMGIERTFGIGVFDPGLGGDPLLFQHLFWFYSHPAVYIMVVPAMGVASEIISCFCRNPVFGYRFMAYAILAIAAFGFVVWGHHMFVSGQSAYAGTVFSLLTFLVSVPSAIKVFNWTATLYKAHVSFEAPMLYALGFVGLFTIGGLTGLFLASLGARCAAARHLFRRRAFPLHHGGRRGHGVLRRHPLLVAEDHGAHVPGRLGAILRDPDVRRLQPDVLPAVHPGLSRHAAPLPGLSARISSLERAVLGRLLAARVRLRAAARLPAVVAAATAPERRPIPGAPRAWNGRPNRRRRPRIFIRRRS